MIQHITKPFKYFFRLEAASGLVLLFAAILALIISNGNLSEYYFNTLDKYITLGTKEFGLKLSVLHWINDVLMAIFFFFVSLEIKREFIQGELSNPKQAMLPIIGAVGGMAIPALFYHKGWSGKATPDQVLEVFFWFLPMLLLQFARIMKHYSTKKRSMPE